MHKLHCFKSFLRRAIVPNIMIFLLCIDLNFCDCLINFCSYRSHFQFGMLGITLLPLPNMLTSKYKRILLSSLSKYALNYE